MTTARLLHAAGPRVSEAGPLRRAAALAGGALAALVAELDRRRARRQLLELDDRELDDIGLTRGDVLRRPPGRPRA